MSGESAEARSLIAGAAVLGVTLDAVMAARLLALLDELARWNRSYNLTSITARAEMITHHLLDSLAVQPLLTGERIVDVGTGAGFPGLPLAIARPEMAVTLVDAVQKKTTFLQQAAIELGLKNVTVHHALVEEMQGQYAQISSRAFADLHRFVSLTRHLLAPGGRWLAMKGISPDAEIAALPAGIVVDRVIPLVVPGVDAERHLIILKAGS